MVYFISESMPVEFAILTATPYVTHADQVGGIFLLLLGQLMEIQIEIGVVKHRRPVVAVDG